MSKVHQKIVQEIVEKYKANKSVIAINVLGSVARGEERPDSDVDIEIITNTGKKWAWSKGKRYGIPIDFVRCAKKHLIYQFEKYPYLCHIYLDKKILYDSTGFMKEMKQKINKYMKGHAEVVRFWEKKLKLMREKKARGQDTKDAIKSFNEAEIRFSKEHKVTRDWFKE